MRNAPGGLLGFNTSAKVQLSLLAQTSAQIGQVLNWNGAAWVPETGTSESCRFFSGSQVGATLIPLETPQPGATPVTYGGNKMKADDLLDELEILKSSIGTAAIPSGAPARYPDTLALRHVGGRGTGS